MSTLQIIGVDFLTNEICGLYNINTKDKNVYHRNIWCLFNIIQYRKTLEGFIDEELCNRISVPYDVDSKSKLVISVISEKIIEILATHISTQNVPEDDALSQIWELLHQHIKISMGEFMDTPDANTSPQKTWPYFSHSAMMLKLQKFDELYKDDSLWKTTERDGKIFSESGKQILESIWNGLFCLGTKFPEKMYWQNEHLHEFTNIVKRICAFPGMQQCFKEHDEVRERRKILYELFNSIKKHELHQYTSHRSDTLSILAVVVIQMLKNLKPNSETSEPSIYINSLVYMNKEEIEVFKSEIENLISTK